jgi:HAD superfamily hydrolase (TIGR01509 family)
MTIRAVFFDMGGTIETYSYSRELRLGATQGIQQILNQGGINLGLSTEQLYEVVSAGQKRYHNWSVQSTIELPAERIWAEYILVDYPQVHAQLRAIAEELMFYVDTRWFDRRMRPEMPAVLAALQKMGLKIGLISNIPSLNQVPYNLEQYGLRQYFDPLVLSSEYKMRKPDPSIFQYAARLAKVPASECAYVGDRVARDIEGAARAGFGYKVQIRHGFAHGESDAGAQPDAVIDNMLELVDLLKVQQYLPCARPGGDSDGQLKALFFDAGDLLYYRPNEGHLFNAFLIDLGISERINPQLQADLKQLAFCNIITRREYHTRLIRSLGIQDEALLKRGIAIMEQEDDEVAIFDGVPETMRTLKAQGFYLGIITDTSLPVATKLRWFERAGFGNVWDSVISSAEVGVRKPDPRIYQAGIEQVGVSFAEAGFVGHKKSELDGAHAVGMTTILFNPDPDASADYTIDHFCDLLALPMIAQKKEA